MIKTWPLFYYGFEITEDNLYLDFKEGSGPQLTAEIDVGSYTPTKFALAVKNALSTAGTLAYDVVFDRTTRKITISSVGGSFKLLTHSGTHLGNDPFQMMGFPTVTDTSLGTSFTGTFEAGDVFAPQVRLQEFVPSENLQGAIDANVNRTAGGRVEVIKFGTESFMECKFVLASNLNHQLFSGYRKSTTGEDDLRRFMQYLTTKAPVEFMADEDHPEEFQTLMLESTTESPKGLKYRLKEMWDKGFFNYYESGLLVFRVIED